MSQPDPQPVGGVLYRIHQLGAATEQMFARLYGGLAQRHQTEEATDARDRVEKRNRQLRRLLRHSTMKMERLESILANISEGIILQDTNGKVLQINAAARDIVGSERNLWQSEVVTLFKAFENVTNASTELVPLGKPRRMTIRNNTVDAQLVGISDSRGARIGSLIILRRDAAMAADDRLKTSLVAHISHELRTPIAPMRLASEVLLAAPTDKAPNRKMLEMISRNVDILDRMVDEMIHISAMSSGALQIEHKALMLEDLLCDIYVEFSDDIAEANLDSQIMIKNYDALIVNGDSKYLRWAITNVLRNSIQYTEANHSIYLRAALDPASDGQRVLIQIGDTGVGISADDLPNIFALFYRGTPRNAAGKRIDPRGLGQGLYVTRQILQAHGGEIYVESRLGEGSVFTLVLPRMIPSLESITQ